jgi:hypothetical protein
MDSNVPLRDRVAKLEDDVLVLRARLEILEAQHVFNVEQMDRVEATQQKILDEVKAIMPAQELIDQLTQKLNETADKLANATVNNA